MAKKRTYTGADQPILWLINDTSFLYNFTHYELLGTLKSSPCLSAQSASAENDAPPGG